MKDIHFRKRARFLCAIFGLLGLSACATSGVIPGRTSGQVVTFNYHHGFFDDGGTIDVVMPGGEKYSGKFVPGQTTSNGLAIGAEAKDPIITSSTKNTSLITAVLLGDKGHSMHCQFQVESPGGGLESGGVGRCELSNHQVIDASF